MRESTRTKRPSRPESQEPPLGRDARISPRVLFIWNVFGLTVLACTVAVIASSAPGPLHLDWPGQPLTAVADWPTVWLPAFLMPTAVFLHVFSARQALRSRAISAPA